MAKFSDFVELSRLEKLLTTFAKTYGFAISIYEYPSNKTLICVNSSFICKEFYRKNPSTAHKCYLSDKELAIKLEKTRKIQIDHCQNGLVHGSIPIIIDGDFLAILHVGQLLFEKPDFEHFREQAKKYNFHEEKFLKQLITIPVIAKNRFQQAFQSLAELATFITEIGIANKKLLTKEELLKEYLLKLESTNLQLKEAHQHKNRFLSHMSHELRTPLNVILGFSQSLKMQYFGNLNDKQLEYIALIHNSGQHLLSLINDILDISKIDAGAMELYLEEISLPEYVFEIHSMMKSQFESKKISFNYKITTNKLKLLVDKRKCSQVLLNLLSNALKFTPENGNVEIIVEDTHEKSNEVKFLVKDSGEGIKKEDIDSIFEEFYQTNLTRDQSLGGAGIGLALSKRLVKLHKGNIGVESTYGNGSTFWFTLPVK